jgi:hypothetical protein
MSVDLRVGLSLDLNLDSRAPCPERVRNHDSTDGEGLNEPTARTTGMTEAETQLAPPRERSHQLDASNTS